MVSRRSEFRRSVVSALAMMLAVALPSLASRPARAEESAEKAHAAKKGRARREAPASKSEETETQPRQAQKAASHAAGKGRKGARHAAAEPPPKRRCVGTTLSIDRGGLEGQTLAVLDCHDRPIESAQLALSALARPWGAQRPAHLSLHPRGARVPAHGGPRGQSAGEIAPGVRLLDKGLLMRLDALAHRFPGRPISLVSGYRPQSRGSQHQGARALDLRVGGVSNEELVAFCKTLADTGCGYYPNSSFVHFDVRNQGTGNVSWIDASGPGETPHYVRQWPLPPEESSEAVLRGNTQPRDDSSDPWTVDPVDEHAAGLAQVPGRP